MAIPVTTRSGKGAPLTQNEMDTNLVELSRDATTVQQGNIEIATVEEATAGTDTTRAITAAGLQAAIDILDTSITETGAFLAQQNGYVQLPTWLGNIMIQWGSTSVPGNSSTAVSFPVNFVSVYSAVATFGQNIGSDPNGVGVSSLTASGMTISNSFGGTITSYWIAIGTGNQ